MTEQTFYLPNLHTTIEVIPTKAPKSPKVVIKCPWNTFEGNWTNHEGTLRHIRERTSQFQATVEAFSPCCIQFSDALKVRYRVKISDERYVLELGSTHPHMVPSLDETWTQVSSQRVIPPAEKQSKLTLRFSKHFIVEKQATFFRHNSKSITGWLVTESNYAVPVKVIDIKALKRIFPLHWESQCQKLSVNPDCAIALQTIQKTDGQHLYVLTECQDGNAIQVFKPEHTN